MDNLLGDIVPFVGFIPISGLGSYSTPSTATLNSFLNTITFAGITASLDGVFGITASRVVNLTTSFDVLGMTYKSARQHRSQLCGSLELCIGQCVFFIY